MNPYGGHNPGQFPQGGQQQGGYQQGPPTQGYPGGPQYGGFPPQQPPGGGKRTPLIVGAIAVVAIVAVAGAVGVGVMLSKDSPSASPVTFSAAATTTGAPTSGAPTASAPATESDSFLTTTTSGNGDIRQVPLKLTAGGAGAGAVQLTGLVGSNTPPPAAVLPWQWEGLASIGDRVSMRVIGVGQVTCSISVNGEEISTDTGTNTATCAIVRSKA